MFVEIEKRCAEVVSKSSEMAAADGNNGNNEKYENNGNSNAEEKAGKRQRYCSTGL